MRFALLAIAPQPGFDHPLAQRFPAKGNPMILTQLFGRQGRTEIPVLVAQGKSLTQPADFRGWLEARQIDFSSIVRVGLEAGAMSGRLCTELSKLGLPMIGLEAFQA